jgi:hypothetical protein
MRGDGMAQHGVVASESHLHCLGMLFPELCAAFNIGEQERDGAGWQGGRGHERGHPLRGGHELIHRQFGTRGADECGVLRLWQLQCMRQPLGDLARGPPRVGLDFTQGLGGAADPLRQRLLGQVERFAPPLQPPSEGDLHSHHRLLSFETRG